MPVEQFSRFEPIFIVGAPRSGTTLLAAIMGRHRRISIPPETQYMLEFMLGKNPNKPPLYGYGALVDELLGNHSIQDLDINRTELVSRYEVVGPGYAGLFQALLECYAKQHSKMRVGEKSPMHLLYAPIFLKWFPKAKFVCIVRDGRDVVESLMKTPWAANLRIRHSLMWRDFSKLARKYSEEYPQSFLVIHYEELVCHPELTIKRVCEFIGETFEPRQLQESGSSAIPDWELAWKAKALEPIDKSRIAAWRSITEPRALQLMEYVMGEELKHWNYPDYRSVHLPIFQRFLFAFELLPYRDSVRPTLRMLKRFVIFAASLFGFSIMKRSKPTRGWWRSNGQ